MIHCRNCVYWKSADGTRGRCRLNPPAPEWSITHKDDGCARALTPLTVAARVVLVVLFLLALALTI